MAERDIAETAVVLPAIRATQCHFPLELIHAIIGDIYSLEDLTSCSLVCRAWAEVAFPKIYSRITIPPSQDYRRAFNDGRIMLRQTKELSSFMRSCVKQVIFELSPQTRLTSQILVEILGLFPNLKDMELMDADPADLDEDEGESEGEDVGEDVGEYEDRVQIPGLQPLENTRPTDFTPVKQRPSLSALRLFCELDLLDFGRRPQHSYSLLTFGGPTDVIPCSSILFRFLSIFNDIEELDLSGISLGRDTRAPDPELAKQLPRIHKIVNSFHDGTISFENTATSIICQHLDSALPICVHDVTFTFSFLSRHPELSYPNITRLSGRFGFHNTRFQISANQLPSLVKLELWTRKSITPHDAQIQTHRYWNPDPLEVFVDGLRHAPSSLRHVTLEIELDLDLNHILNHKRSLSLEDAVIPQLRTMDWNALRRLLESRKDVWESQTITFTVHQQVSFYTGAGRRKVAASVQQVEEVLRKEFPILGSSHVSFSVRLSLL